MSELIYCTYLTVYTGNKLPPFYIGSTSVDKINKGYRGSVTSQKYKSIWKQELRDTPKLFSTHILTYHYTKHESVNREREFHDKLSVSSSSLYINMCHAKKKFFTVGPHSTLHTENITKALRSPEVKQKLIDGQARRGPRRKRTEEEISAMRIRSMGNTNRLGIRHTEESKQKNSESNMGRIPWNRGKKMSLEYCNNLAKNYPAKLYNFIHDTGIIEFGISINNLARKYPEHSLLGDSLRIYIQQNRSYKGWQLYK
tara:strand:+ start:157 stop:924 length:768 start_codon:yes stop_codon:yes gene_type:complete